jgi:uncharacterized repeat protein (TIGR02543 family)
MEKADIVLYAQWKSNTAVPTFDRLAGAIDKGDTVTITSATDGATIYNTTNGDTPTSQALLYSTPIKIIQGMTIKAIAIKEGYNNSEVATASYTIKTYILSYSANGGTGAPDTTITMAYGDSTTLANDIPTKADATFIGWNTDQNGNGTQYASGASFTMGKVNTVLYAQWKSNTAVPTFDRSAGAIDKGDKITITSTTDGATLYYTINETTPTANSFLYTEPVTINNNTTIKAIAVKEDYNNSEVATASYTIKKYSLSYDANGGTDAPGTTYSLAFGDKVTLDNGVPAKTDCTFNGWNTDVNGSGAQYAPGASFTMGKAAIVLYA